ncbi:MAG TPA: NAD(P)H-hydrate dehydratase [Chlamydiales bacterium]|nr:NAD(P)H-hydrate dehydratase [Chlamydiales bacterium]
MAAAPPLPPFFATKVVSSQEMARIDKQALLEGCREEDFINESGKKIASRAIQFIESHHLPKEIALLIGKGNKGADAFAAGIELLEEGYRVVAYLCFSPETCSEWNQKKGGQFGKRRGQKIAFYEGQHLKLDSVSLIIDGLLGTGFKGKVEGKIETAILMANASRQAILAIDLPSGLDGTTGALHGACIQAAATVTLGLAKSGLFLREGWNQIGHLTVADFGLPAHLVERAQEIAYLPNPAFFPLPPIVRNRHKYRAGYVVGFSGSEKMKGAPKMAGLAALRAGAGIVRIFHNGSIGEAPMELICQKWNVKEWRRELKRSNAVFAGPGLGLNDLKRWMKEICCPAVFDADALQKGAMFPKRSILTPHRGEMLRLLGLKALPIEEAFLARCQKFAEKKNIILVLKGAPTYLFSLSLPPLIIPYGDPGMATAGSGDVLTGVLAALLAQKMDPYDAAALGVYLHAIAGEKAAAAKTSYGLIAKDLIDFLPNAWGMLLICKHMGGTINKILG